ncbi:MAG: ATP-dependent DNA helicase RecG [Lachnospiraceae bacterium]|nr:ATP-dependent DNA helicase RecG [Lachnospiraceae bacterium]
MDKSQDIISLKGIGEKTADLYHKVGIYTYGDLMYYYPRDYIKYDEAVTPSPEKTDTFCFIKGIISKRPLLRKAGRMSVVTATIDCSGLQVRAVWFHMPYIARSIRTGVEYYFGAVLKMNGNFYSLEQPLVISKDDYEVLRNTLQPVYPLTKGLSNNSLRKSVKQVLSMYDGTGVIGGMTEKQALLSIHFPADINELKKAREALVYEEFLLFILRLKLLKEENKRAQNGFGLKKLDRVHDIIDNLPYRLTDAQLKVFGEIENDLCSGSSMSRLVQGDVGCGKTIIAFLACVMVSLQGYQCSLMAPTEILATQHYDLFNNMCKRYGLDLNITLLTGSMGAAVKREALADIESGHTDIVIGTHALFQDKVKYSSLALVVTDEQHRFGVRQRELLADKSAGDSPHVLVMSATPIPRTLAIILYGDLDISVIDEVPARRLPIKNCVVGPSYRERSYDFILKEVKNGHQAYVICPMVEESEGLDCMDVVSYSSELKDIFKNEASVACLHGRMKAGLKDSVMKDFASGKTDILVSTTVVEVGVNVPNATVMMVENAERFGLAQLHQLRGRIGRGDAQSYCIFIDGKESEKSRERLEILNRSNDGFFIASEDLKLRGPGDMFGIKQSGELEFKLADIYTDSKILARAKQEAEEILKTDRDLSKPEHKNLRMKLFSKDTESFLKAL